MIHVVEFLLALVIARIIGAYMIRRHVKARLCPDCDGLGRMPHRDKWRPCHTCSLRGYSAASKF